MPDKYIQKLIKPPTHSDLQTKQQIAILHYISLGILANNIILILASNILFDQIRISILSSLAIAAVMAIIQVLIRNERLKFAKWLLPLSYLVLISILILFSGGINSPLISGYFTAAILAGLLLGSTAGFIFGGSSLLILFIVFLLPNNFLINIPVFQVSNRAILIFFSLNLVLIMAVLSSVLNSLERVSRLNREKQIELKKSHQELLDQIRARKTAELHLLQSEERFRSAVLDSPYPMMLFAEDGEIIFINHAWSTLSGFSENEITTWDDWQRKAFRTHINLNNRSSQPVNLIEENQQIKVFTKSGQIRSWIFNTASLPDLPDERELTLVTASDVTDLTQAEQALRESEERYSKITLATNDGIWDWDLVTNAVFFDPQYYTMSGYMVNEFPHRLEEFQKRIHPDDVQRVMQMAQDHLDNKTRQFAVEFRFQRKDSSWQWILGRGKIIEQDHLGNPLRMVGTHTDISSRKRVEQELEAYRKELEEIVEDRTAKLAARVNEVEDLNKALTNLLEDFQKTNQKLSQTSALLEEANTDIESFTYSVSDDLQTPLQTIQNSLGKIPKNKLSADDIKQLKQIEDSSKYLEQQISDLQKLSRLGTQPLQIEIIEMNELVADVVNEIQKTSSTAAEIIVDDLPPCSGDKELLKQVFYHLIKNADKFTQKRKNPQIKIGIKDDSPKIQGFATYFIQDNGVGFAMDQREKLFSLFQRLHSNQEYKGTGIGLAISKRILTRHHGKIWAESKNDEGATFFVSLKSAKR